MGEYLDWQIRRGGCCSEIRRTKPWGTATYKEQFHPHHKDMAASKGKGEESFLHGCNWDLGEAEMEMALREIFFLARKKAFLVDIHTWKICWCWWTAKHSENHCIILCWFGRHKVWFCSLASYSLRQQLPAKGRKFIFVVTSVAELGTEIAGTE